MQTKYHYNSSFLVPGIATSGTMNASQMNEASYWAPALFFYGQGHG